MPIIDPGTLPGLYARYKASDPSSLNVSDGASVTTWADMSGNGRDLLAAGGTVRYLANQINGKGCVDISSSGALACAGFAAAPFTTQRTMIFVWKLTGQAVELFWDGEPGFWVHDGFFDPGSYHADNYRSKMVGDQDLHLSAKCRTDRWHAYSHDADASHGTYAVGLGEDSIDFGSTWCANEGTTVGTNGLFIPRQGDCQVAEILIWGRRLGWAERNQVADYIKSEYNTYVPVQDDDHFVLSLGNSTTQAGYPYALGGLLEDIGVACTNLGWSGGTIAVMNNQSPEIMEYVEDLRGRDKQVLAILHHGHNNGFGQDTIDHIKGGLFSGIRATGAKILALTSSCRYDLGDADAGRILLNDWLRSPEALDFVDAIYDLGGTAEFGVYGDNGTTTGSRVAFPEFWSDSVHPTLAGTVKQAQLMESAVRALLLSSSFALSPTSATAGTSLSVTATGTNTAWTTDTTFAVAGGTGASISGLSVDAGTQVATFTLNPGSASGTLTISDDSDSATATMAVASPPVVSFAVSPTTATAGTPLAITATGSNTLWTTGTTFSVTGGTGAGISGPSVNVSTQVATFTLDPGSAAGTLTIHDSTDSATATVSVSAAPVPSTTTFTAPRNAAASTLASGHSVGSGTLVVASGAGPLFGSPSASAPIRVTCVRASDGSVAIFKVTGRSSETLAIASSLEGTTDLALAAGDKVEMRVSAGYLADVHAAINAIESRLTVGSGAPTSTPADGALYVDAANSKIYARVGGAWKSTNLA